MTRQTTLIDNLTRSGNSPVALDAPDGSRALILPAYGRVPGLYAGDSNENFLWTNPALAAAVSAEGRTHSCERSALWAFRGGFKEISEAMRVLLGIHEINRSNKQGD